MRATKAEKAQPTLADRLIAANPAQIDGYRSMPKLVRALQSRVRVAEKMVFDADASYRVGEVLREIPELIAEQIQFARAPFERTWIEYQSDDVIHALGDPRAIARASPTDPTRDVLVGIMIDHNQAHVFSANPTNKIGLMPFSYTLHTEWPVEDQIYFAEQFGVSRMGIDVWLWGSAANILQQNGKLDLLRTLRGTNMVESLLDMRSLPLTTRKNMYDYSTGDFKNVVALLLMLNQPRLTNYLHVPRRSGWIGNKPKAFMAHHNITVALDAVRRIQLVSEGGSEPQLRRGGHVRGHYCHNETARDYARIAGCVHDWIATDRDWTPDPTIPLDERKHWKCRACDGKRWWRDEYDRVGSGTGFVHHPQYNVTARRAS